MLSPTRGALMGDTLADRSAQPAAPVATLTAVMHASDVTCGRASA